MGMQKRRRGERAPDEQTETRTKERRRAAHEIEHDQDREPPRTARRPGSDEIDDEWGRQEGC